MKKKVLVDLLEKLARAGSLNHLAMLLRLVHEKVLINGKKKHWIFSVALKHVLGLRLKYQTTASDLAKGV